MCRSAWQLPWQTACQAAAWRAPQPARPLGQLLTRRQANRRAAGLRKSRDAAQKRASYFTRPPQTALPIDRDCRCNSVCSSCSWLPSCEVSSDMQQLLHASTASPDEETCCGGVCFSGSRKLRRLPSASATAAAALMDLERPPAVASAAQSAAEHGLRSSRLRVMWAMHPREARNMRRPS